MTDASKTQMIEFINSRCRINGKKIPKTKLNQLTKGDLLKIVTSDEDLEKAFNRYIENELTYNEKISERNKSEKQNIQDYNKYMRDEADRKWVDELEYLIEQIKKDPTSFLTIMEFKSFLNSLPYGSISFEVLSNMVDKLAAIDSCMSLLLFEYTVNQTLYLQNKEKNILK